MGCYEYSPSYWIIFSPNGGEGVADSLFVERDKTVQLPSNSFEHRDEKSILGWATSPGGPVQYKDRASVRNLAADGKIITLYAKWTEDDND